MDTRSNVLWDRIWNGGLAGSHALVHYLVEAVKERRGRGEIPGVLEARLSAILQGRDFHNEVGIG